MSLQKDSAAADENTISELTELTSELNLSTVDDHDLPAARPQKSIDDMLMESYEWLENKRQARWSLDTLSKWMSFGERIVAFDVNTKYANEKIVQRLYDIYLEYELLSDRRNKKQKANPLESVKRAFLMNRSAVKFANIDSLLDYMFSEPVDKLGRSLINENELMYFVDIGGAPGGFADYLLWRRNWQTKGFGIPMKGSSYWSHRLTTGAQRFTVFKGAKRDGDVTNDENISSIVRYVKQHISLGVHIVIADCASEVPEKKYAKETIFKRLYLGEAILALSLLRSNGHFILKLYDILLPFTVGLIYLLHKCFAEVILIKPKTSRPSSAERFLICKWKCNDTETVRKYLEQVNAKLNNTIDSQSDVVGLVPEDILLNDTEFFNFIYKSNNSIAETQTESMIEMIQMTNDTVNSSSDPMLVEACLRMWNILPKNDFAFNCTFGPWAKIVDSPENSLSPLLPLNESFNLPGDKLRNEWHCIRIENVTKDNRTFFSTKDSTEVTMFDPISSKWISVPTVIGLEFPTNTFLYGEIVNHHVHHSDTQSSQAFHIIDGMVLNGQDIRHYAYSMRLDLCKKFANAINNPSRFIKTNDGPAVRSTPVYSNESFLLKDLIPELEKFRKSWKTTANGSKVLGYNVPTVIGPKRFYPVNGLLFMRNFPKINDETNFDETFRCRQLWHWTGPDSLNTVDMEKTPTDGNVYLSHFCAYMNRSVADDSGSLNWRDKNRQDFASRYSNKRGRGGTGGRGRHSKK